MQLWLPASSLAQRLARSQRSRWSQRAGGRRAPGAPTARPGDSSHLPRRQQPPSEAGTPTPGEPRALQAVPGLGRGSARGTRREAQQNPGVVCVAAKLRAVRRSQREEEHPLPAAGPALHPFQDLQRYLSLLEQRGSPAPRPAELRPWGCLSLCPPSHSSGIAPRRCPGDGGPQGEPPALSGARGRAMRMSIIPSAHGRATNIVPLPGFQRHRSSVQGGA